MILDFILIATFLVTTYLIQKIFIYLGLANDGVWIGIFDIVSSIAHILFIILVSISFIVSFKHSKTKLVRRRIPK